MKRRKFLFLLAAGAVALSSKEGRAALCAKGDGGPATDAAFSRTLTNLFLFLKDKAKVICVGDTFHAYARPMDYFVNLENMRTLAENGLKNFSFENGTDAEPCLEQAEFSGSLYCQSKILRNGRLDPAEVRRLAAQMAQTVQALPQVKFHAIDTRSETHRFCDDENMAWRMLGLSARDRSSEGWSLTLTGSGHLTGRTCGSGTSFYDYLEVAGVEPLVVNVYTAKEIYKDYQGYFEKDPTLHRPDVSVLTYPKDGIVLLFKDSELEKEYLQQQKKSRHLEKVSRRKLIRNVLGL